MAAVLDTHTAVWYLLDSNKFSPRALLAIEDASRRGERVYASAISLVEVLYLVERGRLPRNALDRLTSVLKATDSDFRIVPLGSEVAEAVRRVPREVVPDMPDRIIAATALYLNLPLLTRDQKIQSAGIRTIW